MRGQKIHVCDKFDQMIGRLPHRFSRMSRLPFVDTFPQDCFCLFAVSKNTFSVPPAGQMQKTMPWQNTLLRPVPVPLHCAFHPCCRTRQNSCGRVLPEYTYKSAPTSKGGRILPSYPSGHRPSCRRTFPLCVHHDCRYPPDTPYHRLPHDKNVVPPFRKIWFQRSVPVFPRLRSHHNRTLSIHFDKFQSDMLLPFARSPILFFDATQSKSGYKVLL